MKNIKTTYGRPFFRVKVEGMPPLTGWAVKYVSGMGPEIKAGYWMSQWFIDTPCNEAVFNFEPELHVCFTQQDQAIVVSNTLREVAEIETEVVKIG